MLLNKFFRLSIHTLIYTLGRNVKIRYKFLVVIDEFLTVCSFFLSFFYSSPILSRRRLNVCHTSTHGVALLRIHNACLKCAARGSLEMQGPKNRQKFATWAPSHNVVWLHFRYILTHVSTIGHSVMSSIRVVVRTLLERSQQLVTVSQDKIQEDAHVEAVSYTHLTLPTNREV